MKTIVKSLLLCTISALCSTITINADGNNMVADNQKAYHLAAQVAQLYLLYKYESGATYNTCSSQGINICKALSRLSETTRLFYNPAREDLAQLAKNTEIAFRYFDLSGSANDRNAFVRSLINLLQATSSLLSDAEGVECKTLIQRLSQKL